MTALDGVDHRGRRVGRRQRPGLRNFRVAHREVIRGEGVTALDGVDHRGRRLGRHEWRGLGDGRQPNIEGCPSVEVRGDVGQLFLLFGTESNGRYGRG